MKIEWTRRARTDIQDIKDYIAKDSPHYAYQFTERIFNATEKLAIFSQLGRRVPEAQRDDVRELIFQKYRIIHRLTDDCIYITAIVHGSRDLKQLGNEPWEVG